ncbi:MAG: hypothetical protein HN348_15280, partial [Proteobacteria bacterium]|nr:hypothetical protein [Pseudomonadota bacterium]
MQGDGLQLGEIPLTYYLNVLRRRRNTVLIFAGILMVTVLVSSLLSTKYYVAVATIEINPQAPVFMEGLTEVVPTGAHGFNDQLYHYKKTQHWVIESRLVLTEAARRLEEVHGITEYHEGASAFATLNKGLSVSPLAETHLVRLVVEYVEPEQAALFANVVAETYMDVNMDRTLEASRLALKWLTEQQQLWRAKGFSSEKEVATYQKKHGLVVPDSTITAETLEKLQSEWSNVHAQRVSLAGRTDELVELSASSGGYLALADFLSATNQVLNTTLTQYQEKKQEKSSMKTTFREAHPEMQKVDLELNRLQDQIKGLVQSHVEGQEAAVKLLVAEEQGLGKSIEYATNAMAVQSVDMIDLRFLSTQADLDKEFYQNL